MMLMRISGQSSQFDMTVADSEDSDLHSSPSVSPRHHLLGDSDTEFG